MPSELQRVTQGLVDCLDEAPRIVAALQRRADICRRDAADVMQLSSGQATVAAQQLDAAARACESAAHYLSMAAPKARNWALQMVDGLHSTGLTSGDSSTRRPDAAGGSRPPADGRRDDDCTKPEAAKPSKAAKPAKDDSPEPSHPQPNPTQFQAVAREILERLPVRQRRDKTRGIWIDSDGHEHDLISGVDEYTDEVDRFIDRHDIAIAPGEVTLGSHVEVKFALRMRRLGLTDEIITINNRPCPGPYGCDENLEQFLPEGARLTIFGPGFTVTYPRPDEDTP